MDQIKEYHDPDYPEAAVCVKEEPPSLSEEEKVEKIKSIIHREFSNELETRENEIMLIDQRQPAQPKKVPRHLEPKATNVVTLDEATRNQMKHRYRFIIELHFTLPERNRPASVEHNIKLDRNYTGMQTLGSETIVDVWLYSTPEMLQYEYIEDDHTLTDIQTTAPTDTTTDTQTENILEDVQKIKEEDKTDNWMDFFKTPTELDVDEMFIKPSKPVSLKQEIENIDLNATDFEEKIDSEIIDSIQKDRQNNILQVPSEILSQPASIKKRIVKYIDPRTGKIYYLEMDRELDLTKVQEIIINNTTTKISPIKSNGLKSVRKKKGGVSLLKPEVKNQIKTENSIKNDRLRQSFPHLENDHCYLANPKVTYPEQTCVFNENEVEIRREGTKLINNLLSNHFTQIPIWRTKQILLYIRLHGHHPVRPDTAVAKSENQEWSSWKDLETSDTNIKEIYPNAADISSLSVFKFDIDRSLTETVELSDDEDIDILSSDVKVSVKREAAEASGLHVLPVEKEDDRLRFMFIEKKCAD
ncbi:putative YEATS domain containing 2, partial [Operophtera brumata]